VIGINGNGDGGSQSPLNGAYVSNGAGVNNIDITADGAHVSDPGCNCATPVNPNTDMIQEFKVLTSNFSAENSKGPIVINSIAKAGGHDFHGEAYFSARHHAMNANRWVNDYTGTAKPANKFLFPGGNIGGPVLLPHTDFNRNRDKLFFFSGFEYYYQTLDTGLLGATVPTAGMLNGNFSPTELAKLGTKTAGGGAPSQLNSCLTVSPTPTTIDNNGNYVCGDSNNAGDPTKPGKWLGGQILTYPGQPAPALAPLGGMFPSGLISQVGQKMLGPNVVRRQTPIRMRPVVTITSRISPSTKTPGNGCPASTTASATTPSCTFATTCRKRRSNSRLAYGGETRSRFHIPLQFSGRTGPIQFLRA